LDAAPGHRLDRAEGGSNAHVAGAGLDKKEWYRLASLLLVLVHPMEQLRKASTTLRLGYKFQRANEFQRGPVLRKSLDFASGHRDRDDVQPSVRLTADDVDQRVLQQ